MVDDVDKQGERLNWAGDGWMDGAIEEKGGLIRVKVYRLLEGACAQERPSNAGAASGKTRHVFLIKRVHERLISLQEKRNMVSS